MKECSKCGVKKELSAENYSQRKHSKDGFNNQCKDCKRKYNRKYQKENREKIKRQKKEYYEENKEWFSEKNKEYRKENRPDLIKYNRKYYRENREDILEQKKEYYAENREDKLAYRRKYHKENSAELNEYARIYYQENKAYHAMYSKKYRAENKDLRNVLEQKRRTLKKSLESNFTLKEWEYVKCCFDNKCAYCGVEKDLAQDHFIPLSKRGEYTINNIIPSCFSCNSSKKDKLFHEWYPNFIHYSKAREEKVLKHLNYFNENVQQLSLM